MKALANGSSAIASCFLPFLLPLLPPTLEQIFPPSSRSQPASLLLSPCRFSVPLMMWCGMPAGLSPETSWRYLVGITRWVWPPVSEATVAMRTGVVINLAWTPQHTLHYMYMHAHSLVYIYTHTCTYVCTGNSVEGVTGGTVGVCEWGGQGPADTTTVTHTHTIIVVAGLYMKLGSLSQQLFQYEDHYEFCLFIIMYKESLQLLV